MNGSAQQDLVLAILAGDPSGGLAPAGLVSVERGLAAYRNNLRVLAGQALANTFQQVAAELGAADFAAMAWSYWRASPPQRGDLAEWGQTLPDFLANHAGEDSGLPRLARLDWALHRAERAADVALDAESLSLLAVQPLDALGLRLRPAVQLVGGHLVWREGWKARSRELTLAEHAFWAAVLGGRSLAAAMHAAEVNPDEVKGLEPSADFDFSVWLQDALRHEWLHEVVHLPDSTSESTA